jgi:hypothetical protein
VSSKIAGRGEGRHSERTSVPSGRLRCVCSGVVLQLQPPNSGSRNLDSNVGLFRNACQAECCESLKDCRQGKEATLSASSSVRGSLGVCALVWCCSCTPNPVLSPGQQCRII